MQVAQLAGLVGSKVKQYWKLVEVAMHLLVVPEPLVLGMGTLK
jgi:hypothetical protein